MTTNVSSLMARNLDFIKAGRSCWTRIVGVSIGSHGLVGGASAKNGGYVAGIERVVDQCGLDVVLRAVRFDISNGFDVVSFFLYILVLPLLILYVYFLFARERLTAGHKWSLWLGYVISILTSVLCVKIIDLDENILSIAAIFLIPIAVPVAYCVAVHQLAISFAPRHVIPSAITDGLKKFKRHRGRSKLTGFLMMRFGDDEDSRQITESIESLKEIDITILRADSYTAADLLSINTQVFMHGCSFGVAFFEAREGNVINPNVALEVGYMTALNKPVLLLKDKNLAHLQTDLRGALYKEYDSANINGTVPRCIREFLREKLLA